MIRFSLLGLLAYGAAVLETVIHWPGLFGEFAPCWMMLVLVMGLFLLRDALRIPFALVVGILWDASVGWPLGVGMLMGTLLAWGSLYWREFWLCKSAVLMSFSLTLLGVLFTEVLSRWLNGTYTSSHLPLKTAAGAATSSAIITIVVLGAARILGTGLFQRDSRRRKINNRWSMLTG